MSDELTTTLTASPELPNPSALTWRAYCPQFPQGDHGAVLLDCSAHHGLGDLAQHVGGLGTLPLMLLAATVETYAGSLANGEVVLALLVHRWSPVLFVLDANAEVTFAPNPGVAPLWPSGVLEHVGNHGDLGLLAAVLNANRPQVSAVPAAVPAVQAS